MNESRHVNRVRLWSLVLAENLSKAPDFVKGVAEWRRRDADHVGLAKIAFHTTGY